MFNFSLLAMRDDDHVLGSFEISHPDPVEIDHVLSKAKIVSQDIITEYVRVSPTTLRCEIRDLHSWPDFMHGAPTEQNAHAVLQDKLPFGILRQLKVEPDAIWFLIDFDVATFAELDTLMRNVP